MAMNRDQHAIDDQAVAWVVRVRDADFEDWDAFEAWLGASPAHADAYHRFALEDTALDALLPAFAPAPVAASERRTLRRWAWPAIGAAVAAMLVGVVTIHMPATASQRYQIATQAGERRALILAGGTTILLNGQSTLVLDRKDPRFAELKQGEALFTVTHDAAHPFAVQVGQDQLRDVGTRFDVVRDRSGMRVAVAEGAVVYNPATQNVMLSEGDMLRVAAGGTVAVRSRVAPDQVGTWREGRFMYAGEPLARVAEDLSRYAGARVEVSPDLAAQPFRGVISIADPARLEGLGPLFRARVQRRGDGWLISRH